MIIKLKFLTNKKVNQITCNFETKMLMVKAEKKQINEIKNI